uniref:Uncharacterized protein n=1 Tax=Anguilla anguilla TaxID=7936 RepID=A0A0E9R2J8_ANGAN
MSLISLCNIYYLTKYRDADYDKRLDQSPLVMNI